jgi:transposase
MQIEENYLNLKEEAQMARRHELSDDQWEMIEDLLPGKVGDPGRTAVDNRLFVNAVLFVLKTGIPWEDLTARYGKPKHARPYFNSKRPACPYPSRQFRAGGPTEFSTSRRLKQCRRRLLSAG